LGATFAGAQHVERDPCCDRRQPSTEIVNPAIVGLAVAQPRLLDSVLGLRDRAQHPVSLRPQVRALLFKLLGPPFVCAAHLVTSLRLRVSIAKDNSATAR